MFRGVILPQIYYDNNCQVLTVVLISSVSGNGSDTNTGSTFVAVYDEHYT